MSDEFKTRTENEYLRRTHSLTLKVVGCALVALIVMAYIFTRSAVFLAQEHTKQIQIIMSAPVEAEITREVTKDIRQGANTGDNSTVNQTVGK